ncbi:methyltransferase domain-containing protein [Arthrobacter sp. BL-252-APC-1A]|uniref:putative RNA methyltransferase n=1 Tax=Arthrobacter sp. BL-252-APC-1A TaxID=2606622 RepID=UPI0012B438FE|nr:methyltransferase domain-containing protein [Arthrobacter sp. BL-252-APC-1A]MSR97629.1 methyltransferase domain-containing protein [Arthrobacter sp. BL-252-APC-1A]
MPTGKRRLLACPNCGGELLPDEARSRLSCPAGHRFDAARQGYFNLLTGAGTKFQADTAQMVQARCDFLAAGHYAPLARRLGLLAAEAAERPVLLDAGAGTGYYLNEVRKTVDASESVALDISKFALRRAARALPGGYALVWDVWRTLPLADGAADILLNVFAPRNPNEFRRVLAPGGMLLVVTPMPEHLQQIRALTGMLDIADEKEMRVARSLGPSFAPGRTEHVQYRMELDRADVQNAVMMGPSAHHVDSLELSKTLDGVDFPLAVTASFAVQQFRAAEAAAG